MNSDFNPINPVPPTTPPNPEPQPASTPDSIADAVSPAPAPEPVQFQAQTPATTEVPMTSAPVETIAPTDAVPGAIAAPAPAKKSKKGLLIGIIVFLLVLIGGGAAAFFLIIAPKLDPENNLANMVSEMVASPKASMSLTTIGTLDDDGTKLELSLNMKGDSLANRFAIDGTAKYNGEPFSEGLVVGFSGFFVNGAVYIKVNGITDVLSGFQISDGADNESTNMFMELLGSIAELVDDQYIKISMDDLEAFEDMLPIDDSTMCMLDAASKMEYNQITVAEARAIYDANKPLQIVKTLDSVDGLTPFQIDITTPEAVQKYLTEISKATGSDISALQACNPDINFDLFDIFENLFPQEEDDKVEITVVAFVKADLFNPYLDRIEMTDKDSIAKSTIRVNDVSSINITAPSDFVTLTELTDNITETVLETLWDLGIAAAEKEKGEPLTAEEIAEYRAMFDSQYGEMDFMQLAMMLIMIAAFSGMM